MTVKKEVHELVKQLRSLEIGCPEWHKLINTLTREYKMSPYSILSLFGNPPVVEYDEGNKHLLLEV